MRNWLEYVPDAQYCQPKLLVELKNECGQVFRLQVLRPWLKERRDADVQYGARVNTTM